MELPSIGMIKSFVAADLGVAPFYAVLSGKVNIETAQETHDLSEGDFLVARHSSGPSRRCRRT
jgi:hypothetical protein